MQILMILWEPNRKWFALSEQEQAAYLRSLDGAINEARSHGVMTLGWSKVDRSLNKAPGTRLCRRICHENGTGYPRT